MILAISRMFKNFETRIDFEKVDGSLFCSLLQGIERVENYLGKLWRFGNFYYRDDFDKNILILKILQFFFLIKFQKEMINRAEFCILQDNDPKHKKEWINNYSSYSLNINI